VFRNPSDHGPVNGGSFIGPATNSSDS
jgi:hypothetical protein